MIVQDNRIGKFHISEKTIRHHPEVCIALLSKVLVVRAEMSFYRNAVEYLAYSEAFEPCDQIEMPPDYDLVYETETDVETGEVTRTPIGFVRVK